MKIWQALLGCLLFLCLATPGAGAATPAQLRAYRETAARLYEDRQISEEAYRLFTAAADIYLALEEGHFAGEAIVPLVAASLTLEEQSWSRQGEIAGKSLALLKSLQENYGAVNDILAASELWAPNREELELLLFARRLLDQVQGREDSPVHELGRVWENIAHRFREEKPETLAVEEPRWRNLKEEEARQALVAYAGSIAGQYQRLLRAQEEYGEREWAFLEGEGLLPHWQEYRPPDNMDAGWEFLPVPLFLVLCIGLLWLARRGVKQG